MDAFGMVMKDVKKPDCQKRGDCGGNKKEVTI